MLKMNQLIKENATNKILKNISNKSTKIARRKSPEPRKFNLPTLTVNKLLSRGSTKSTTTGLAKKNAQKRSLIGAKGSFTNLISSPKSFKSSQMTSPIQRPKFMNKVKSFKSEGILRGSYGKGHGKHLMVTTWVSANKTFKEELKKIIKKRALHEKQQKLKQHKLKKKKKNKKSKSIAKIKINDKEIYKVEEIRKMATMKNSSDRLQQGELRGGIKNPKDSGKKLNENFNGNHKFKLMVDELFNNSLNIKLNQLSKEKLPRNKEKARHLFRSHHQKFESRHRWENQFQLRAAVKGTAWRRKVKKVHKIRTEGNEQTYEEQAIGVQNQGRKERKRMTLAQLNSHLHKRKRGRNDEKSSKMTFFLSNENSQSKIGVQSQEESSLIVQQQDQPRATKNIISSKEGQEISIQSDKGSKRGITIGGVSISNDMSKINRLRSVEGRTSPLTRIQEDPFFFKVDKKQKKHTKLERRLIRALKVLKDNARSPMGLSQELHRACLIEEGRNEMIKMLQFGTQSSLHDQNSTLRMHSNQPKNGRLQKVHHKRIIKDSEVNPSLAMSQRPLKPKFQ